MLNWKTTSIGLAIAILVAIQNYAGANTWQGYLHAALVAALGFVAKDFNVTGTGK